MNVFTIRTTVLATTVEDRLLHSSLNLFAVRRVHIV